MYAQSRLKIRDDKIISTLLPAIHEQLMVVVLLLQKFFGGRLHEIQGHSSSIEWCKQKTHTTTNHHPTILSRQSESSILRKVLTQTSLFSWSFR
jgi:hypothetical protein